MKLLAKRIKLLKKISLSFFLSYSILFTGCNSNNNHKEDIDPYCKMPITTKQYSAKIDNTKFDDIGCMILWAKENNINLDKITSQVFVNDIKKYINSKKAYYKIDAKTPMHYGFEAFEKRCNKCITFDKVRLKMLRGEHMANPKIRKQILGY